MESASSADLARLLTAPNGAPADVIEAWLVTGRAPVRSVGDTCRHAGLVIADRALRIRQYVAGRIRRIRRR